MNEQEILKAWQVNDTDLTGRIHDAILVSELRELRTELASLRRSNELLLAEVRQLRADQSRRQPIRLAPFTPSESLSRLS